MELQADKPKAYYILPALHILVHTIFKRDALQAYKSSYYHPRTHKKGIFITIGVWLQKSICMANKSMM